MTLMIEQASNDNAAAGPLGTIARKVSPFEESRLFRWALQAEVRDLLPAEKVSYCLRRQNLGTTDVLFDQEHRRAHYAGLMTCGSVWMCPLCAAKISERRRAELSSALTVCNANLALVCMQTYTFSHKRFDTLSASLQSFLAARKRAKQGKRYQGMKSEYAVMGTISALEVTWSARNGWHPHMHELIMFGSQDIAIDAYEADARAMWSNAVRLEGLTANKHGYKLDRTRGGVEDYIAKWGHEPTRPVWGPEAEVSKGHIKQARSEKGKTAFGLLADSFHGDQEAGRLFIEFAKHFKGKHQLHWSKGLKALMGLAEKSDEVIAGEDREESTLLGQLSREQWSIVLGNEARGELLAVADQGDWSLVENFLDSL